MVRLKIPLGGVPFCSNKKYFLFLQPIFVIKNYECPYVYPKSGYLHSQKKEVLNVKHVVIVRG